MKFFSKYFPNRSLLLVIAISTGLLAAACNGSPGPAPSAETTAPGVASEFSDSPENSPDSAANRPSKAAATATRNEETTKTTTSTPNPIVTSEAYPTRKSASAYADLEIITLLPPDAIPSIDNPQFFTAEEADDFYDPQELVMGVSFNGDSRAYSAPFLSNHEIVNDTVGGEKIAVTW